MRKIKFLGFSIGLEWLLLVSIVIAGAFLRIEFSNHLKSVSPDGVAYIYHSSQIIEGSGGFERRGPLFQFLLVIVYKAFGVSFDSSILLPQFFGSTAVVLIFLLGNRFFDSKTGLIAALIVTLNPFLNNFSAWVLRETLSVTLILLLILIIHFSIKISSWKSLFAIFFSGIVAGLIILNREEMLVVIPPACIAYLFFIEKQKLWTFLKKLIIFILAILIIMSPWLIYSFNNFGDPLYGYLYYTKDVFRSDIQNTIPQGELTNNSMVFIQQLIRIGNALVFGLWRLLVEFPALFSLFALFFLPIGIMYTVKRRDLWIMYFILAADLFVVSILAYLPWYFDAQVMAYNWSDPTRFLFSAAIPFNLIIAVGIGKLIPLFRTIKLSDNSTIQNIHKPRFFRRGKNWKRLSKMHTYIFSFKTLIILAIFVLAIASYIPAYIFTIDYFDEKSNRPYVEAANYLNSIGSPLGVFTTNPDLLSQYYYGDIYKTPEGNFELIREEARQKGVKYLLLESTSIASLDLMNLYYKSVYPEYNWNIPSDFILAQSKRWTFGLYAIEIETEVVFKSAILGTSAEDSSIQWKITLNLLGGSTTTFDQNTNLLNINLSEFKLVVFNDFRRSLNETELEYLVSSIKEGLVVVISGLSPYYIAGGTSDLTQISSWFGATKFSEAPKQERWHVKFSEHAIDILNTLDLEREYDFSADYEWSTPIGVVSEPEAVVYCYRVNDELATILINNYYQGSSIFIGPRFGFYSQDVATFRPFLYNLIKDFVY